MHLTDVVQHTQWKCAVGKGILFDPVVLNCDCHTLACRVCAISLSACPVCHKPLSSPKSKPTTQAIRVTMDALHVACRHCTEPMTQGQFIQHLKHDLCNQMQLCRRGCGAMLSHTMVAQHDQTCLDVSIACEWGCGETMKRLFLHEHSAVCAHRPGSSDMHGAIGQEKHSNSPPTSEY